MFASMQQTFRQMEICSAFADQLIGKLRGAFPNLPTTSGMLSCFRIQLRNGYALSVTIPADKNRRISPTSTVDRITVETALLKDDELVYNDELGYSDVRCHDFGSAIILNEYERLMALLAERN